MDGTRIWRAIGARPRIAVSLSCLSVLLGGVVCYFLGVGDIPGLWELRAIRPGAPPYSDRFIEYPVVVGTMLWVVSFGAKSAVSTYGVFLVVAIGLVAVTTAALHRVNARGAVLWATSPLVAVWS